MSTIQVVPVYDQHGVARGASVRALRTAQFANPVFAANQEIQSAKDANPQFTFGELEYVYATAEALKRSIRLIVRSTGLMWNNHQIDNNTRGMLQLTNVMNNQQTFDPTPPTLLRNVNVANLLLMYSILIQSDTPISILHVEYKYIINLDNILAGAGNPRIPDWLKRNSGLTEGHFKATWMAQPVNCAAFVVAYNITTNPAQRHPAVLVKAQLIQQQMQWGHEVSLKDVLTLVDSDEFSSYRVTIIQPPYMDHSTYTKAGCNFKYEAESEHLPTKACLKKIIYLVYDLKTRHFGGCRSPHIVLQRNRAGRRWCHKCCYYFPQHSKCKCSTNVPKQRLRYCEFCGKVGCDGNNCFRRCQSCKSVFKHGYDALNGQGHRCIVWETPDVKTFGSTEGTKPMLWVYDFESAVTRVEDEFTLDFVCDETGFVLDSGQVRTITVHPAKHDVNLIVYKNVYGTELVTYFGADALENFIRDMTTINDGNNVCIAHNGSGYDTRLIFEQVIAMNLPHKMDPISRGTKFMQLTVGEKTVFKDSLLFLPSSLSSLAKSFDLPMRKGIFPHLFNSAENFTYVGKIPDKSMFDLSFYAKSQKDVDAFHTWYNDRAKTGWNFMEELVNYCQDDVRILSMIVQKFNEICVGKFQISPWFSTTAPSYVHKVVSSILTGVVDADLPEQDETLDRNNAITELAWDHHWAVLQPHEYWMARNALRGGRTDARRLQYTLTPEDIAAGRKIAYVDVVSLYPAVQVKYPYPVGLPHIHIYDEKYFPCNTHRNPSSGNTFKGCSCPYEQKKQTLPTLRSQLKLSDFSGRQPTLEFLNNEKTFGFITASLTPPKTLFHPVLVTWDETRNKCMASLEPIVEDTFTTVEFKLALAMGYRLDKVHRLDVYKYKDGLWNDFIKDLYIEKLANSGPPPPEEERQAIVDQYETHFGMGEQVRESFPRWKKDGAMRSTFKTLLNCGWGKHCQRPYLPKMTIMNYDEFDAAFFENLDSQTIQLKSITEVGNTTLVTTIDNGLNTNANFHKTYIPAGVFVPSYGRVTLYAQMMALGDRVLYHDTDSIIYIYDPEKYNIPQSPLWGDWDEEDISKKGITSFVSLGPKSYGIRAPGQDILKLKGLSIKHSHRSLVNFDLLKEQIDTYARGDHMTTEVPQMNFVYKPGKGIKTTKSLKKLEFSIDALKGFIGPDFKVFPLGYCVDCAWGRDHVCE